MAYLELAPPQGTEIEDWVAFSPDGKRIAFPASDVSDRRQLWVRDLGTGTSRSLAGTNDARSPFWSPDGQSIAFFADGRLRIVDSEGRIRMVCEAVGIRTGGTWSPSGVIVFASEANVPLMKVNADGKSPPTPFDGLHGFRPQFLPDGRHVLFAGRQGIEVVNVDTGKRLTLRPTGREPKYVDGHLLFVEEQRVLAQPFDPDGMTLSGEPLAIADIGPFRGDVGGNYSVAGSRLLAFKRATPSNRQLVWRARDGTQLGVIDGAGDWWNPALSPDDSRVAAQRNELQGTEYDIWVHEVARGAIRILSSARANEILPFWTAGGAHIAFQRVDQAIIAKPADGGPEVLLLDKGFSRGSAVGLSPDERLLLTFRLNTDGNRDIVVVPLDGRTDPFPFAATPFNETQPALSPDGAWLAYTSDELGLNSTRDVFIQAFPGGGKKQHVTAETGGGLQPRWRRDGRELYFLSLDSRLMAVPVERTAGTLGLGKPRALFQIAVGSDGGLGTRAAYDVTRDGQRFIVAEDRSGRSADATPVTVLVDWIRAVRAQNR